MKPRVISPEKRSQGTYSFSKERPKSCNERKYREQRHGRIFQVARMLFKPVDPEAKPGQQEDSMMKEEKCTGR